MSGACAECSRRGQLLGELGAVLDYESRRPERLAELLALEDAELIDALGGRRREALRAWHSGEESLRGAVPPPRGGVELCRHERRFPAALRHRCAPAMLTVLGGAARLSGLLARPAVAFVDTREASGYGCAMATSIARGLSAAGVTVVAGASGAIAQAAHEGAQQTGASLCVVGEPLDAIRSSTAQRVARAATRSGCAISELPWGCAGRRWGSVAAERIVAWLGTVAVVVEAPCEERGLWATRLAARVGAVPGMITNQLAAGPHTLIAAGARLISGAVDVLDLLHEAGAQSLPREAAARSTSARLSPRLRRVLDLVGQGVDSAERLASASAQADSGDRDASTWGTAAALGELEARGLIVRSEHGRYVRRDPACAG